MTVKQLIEELKKMPEDYPVALMDDIGWAQKDDPNDIKLKICVWQQSNYPYDKPDFEYVNLT